MPKEELVLNEPGPYDLYADILRSKKVGVTHIRLTGEAVVAQARFNEWMALRGKASLSPDAWEAIALRVLDREDRLHEAWERIMSAQSVAESHEQLPELAAALQDIAAIYDVIHKELKAEFG